MKIFNTLKDKAAKHKIIAGIAAVMLLCAAGAGIFFGIKQYQYRQTSQFAFEKLKQALNPPNAEKLAQLIDFNKTSEDMAKEIAQKFPFFMAGSDQIRNIRQYLQKSLLAAFIKGNEPDKKNAAKEEESEAKELAKELYILPPDFADQLAKNLALRESGGETAIINAKIEHPQLHMPFNILLKMQKGPDGWVIRGIANAKELASQMRDAMIKRHARLREVYEEKNANTQKKMTALLPIQSCTVDAGLLSDNRTFVMIVHITAQNRGNVQVNNFSIDTSIYGRDGKMITRRFLNAAKPAAPGEMFSHRFSFELESQSPLAQELMNGIPLTCNATWQTLGLNNSQVWHMEAVPNPDILCAMPGHNHPDGFCILPVFKPK